MNDPFPASAVALGDILTWKDGRQISDTAEYVFEFPKGWLLTFSSRLGSGPETDYEIFYGQERTLDTRDWISRPAANKRPDDATDTAARAADHCRARSRWQLARMHAVAQDAERAYPGRFRARRRLLPGPRGRTHGPQDAVRSGDAPHRRGRRHPGRRPRRISDARLPGHTLRTCRPARPKSSRAAIVLPQHDDRGRRCWQATRNYTPTRSDQSIPLRACRAALARSVPRARPRADAAGSSSSSHADRVMRAGWTPVVNGDSGRRQWAQRNVARAREREYQHLLSQPHPEYGRGYGVGRVFARLCGASHDVPVIGLGRRRSSNNSRRYSVRCARCGSPTRGRSRRRSRLRAAARVATS